MEGNGKLSRAVEVAFDLYHRRPHYKASDAELKALGFDGEVYPCRASIAERICEILCDHAASIIMETMDDGD